jgi:hypothetical protein
MGSASGRHLGGIWARKAIYRLPPATKHRREYKADIKTTDRGHVGVPDAEVTTQIAESAMAAHMSVACTRIWPPTWPLEHAASDQDGPVGACRSPSSNLLGAGGGRPLHDSCGQKAPLFCGLETISDVCRRGAVPHRPDIGSTCATKLLAHHHPLSQADAVAMLACSRTLLPRFLQHSRRTCYSVRAS